MVFNRFVDCAIVADSDTAAESIVPVRPLFCASYPTCSPTLRYDRCSSVADNSCLACLALPPFDETQTKSCPLLQACRLHKLLVGYFLAVICLLGLLAPECVVYILSLLGLFSEGLVPWLNDCLQK